MASASLAFGWTTESRTKHAVAPSAQLAVTRGRSLAAASTGSTKNAVAVSENGPPDA